METPYTRQKAFRLPMTATFSLHVNSEGKAVAHALDFDLVAVADTYELALEKLRLTAKMYIEYGLVNNLSECIPSRAPDEYWNALTGSQCAMLPPLEIEDNRVFVFSATSGPRVNEPGRSACVAS